MDAYMNAKFSEVINDQMRVPKRIRATGEGYFDDHHELLGNGNAMNSWNYHEKLDMNVPDRIVVIGQDQHLGSKSAPREMMLENSILPKDPSHIRVSTPPRVITLSEHHFPSASDEPEYDEQENSYFEPKSLDYEENKKHVHNRNNANRRAAHNTQEMVINPRDGTPPFSGSIENLSSHDEVLHLRKQVAKLNRRLLNVEIDNLQRNQREKIICCVGLAYFVLKTLFWLNRK
ncbi:unnamed protein product [Diamesa serratosioi]